MAKSEVPEKAIELIEELYCLCLPWREAEIRAEALREAADRAVAWWHEGDCVMTEQAQIKTLRAAIFAGEVEE